MPDITYLAPAGPLPAHLAVPAGQDPWPGVVVVHDPIGYTADLLRITDRFAENGYLAVASALFRRGNRIQCIVSTFKSLSAGEGPAIDDLVAARDHLAADGRCTGKVGLIGFCMGGGFCLQLAPRGVFDAAAPNYGVFPKDIAALRGSCPVVASTARETACSVAPRPSSRRFWRPAMWRATSRSTRTSGTASSTSFPRLRRYASWNALPDLPTQRRKPKTRGSASWRCSAST
jgi:dienelactone hydrolase